MLKKFLTITIVISSFILFIFLQNYPAKNRQLVAVAIVEKNGKILIAQRTKKDAFENRWAFLGGKVEGNENIHDCLKRELKEEIGINAEIGEYFGTNSFYVNQTKFELHTFKVTQFTGEITLNHEHRAFAWVTPSELCNYDIIEPNLPFVRRIQCNCMVN